MYCDLPDFKRCCFFVPLRHGVLIFGYLNLIFSILMIMVFSWYAAYIEKSALVPALYHGTYLETHIALPLILYSIEIVFILILIVGAHMKKENLMRIYMYYGLATAAATLLCFVTFTIIYFKYMAIENAALGFAGFVLQVYLFLLVRSEIKKLELERNNRFENHFSQVYQNMMTEPYAV